MTLYEMSASYGEEATRIRVRIRALRAQARQAEPREREALERRITELLPLAQQAFEIAEVTGHYYERGYHIREGYTL